jgi:hypothetical protein
MKQILVTGPNLASRLVRLAVLLVLLTPIGCTGAKPDDLVGSWTMTNGSRRVPRSRD